MYKKKRKEIEISKHFNIYIYIMMQQIDTTFNVWVLLSSRQNRNVQLPDIGGDPSVSF